MPGQENQPEALPGSAEAQRAVDGEQLFRLLRYSHIFASVVREILEMKLLRRATHFPLTLSQFHVLKLMCLNGRHPLGHVAGFLGVSAPAATKNVDKLERLGLVVRTPSKTDRRETLLSVSPKGRRLVRKYEEMKAGLLAPVLDAFEPEELEQLARLLERFSLCLVKQENGGEDGLCLRCAAYCEDGCPIGRIRGGCTYEKFRAD